MASKGLTAHSVSSQPPTLVLWSVQIAAYDMIIRHDAYGFPSVIHNFSSYQVD